MKAPNSKHQIPNKFQSPKSKKNLFGHLKLEFGAYLVFACLPVGREFVIWDFIQDAHCRKM
jgi:hypothetical protein